MSAQLIITIHAGLIPNQPIPEHSRRWSMTHEEIRNLEIYKRVHGEMMMHMLHLQDPQLVNWVHCDWVWL